MKRQNAYAYACWVSELLNSRQAPRKAKLEAIGATADMVECGLGEDDEDEPEAEDIDYDPSESEEELE